MMKHGNWIQEFPAAITVCDSEGIILAMNNKSCVTFATEGGKNLIGTNMLSCHPEPARTKVAGGEGLITGTWRTAGPTRS